MSLTCAAQPDFAKLQTQALPELFPAVSANPHIRPIFDKHINRAADDLATCRGILNYLQRASLVEIWNVFPWVKPDVRCVKSSPRLDQMLHDQSSERPRASAPSAP